MQADATLSGLLTGGIYVTNEVSRQLTPSAFDDVTAEILPCALVTTPGEFADGPDEYAGRLNATIFFYQRIGYGTIDQAKDRARALFHRQKVGSPADKVWEMRWVNSVTEQRDQALDASMHVIRFEIVRYIG